MESVRDSKAPPATAGAAGARALAPLRWLRAGTPRLRAVKQHAAGLPAGELAGALVKYLYQDGGKREQAEQLVALQPEVGLYAYLLGRQLQGRAAVEALDRSLRLHEHDEPALVSRSYIVE